MDGEHGAGVGSRFHGCAKGVTRAVSRDAGEPPETFAETSKAAEEGGVGFEKVVVERGVFPPVSQRLGVSGERRGAFRGSQDVFSRVSAQEFFGVHLERQDGDGDGETYGFPAHARDGDDSFVVEFFVHGDPRGEEDFGSRVI